MQKNKGLSGAVLKAIALLAMFIDHFAVVIVQGVLLPRASSANIEAMRTAYTIMRGIGRIAFPIYCVLLAEGLRYTHDRFRYLMQLLLLSVLSEIPYDLAFSRTWIAPKEQNIFWTLMLSLLVIWLFDIAYEIRDHGSRCRVYHGKEQGCAGICRPGRTVWTRGLHCGKHSDTPFV